MGLPISSVMVRASCALLPRSPAAIARSSVLRSCGACSREPAAARVAATIALSICELSACGHQAMVSPVDGLTDAVRDTR